VETGSHPTDSTVSGDLDGSGRVDREMRSR